MRENSNPPRRGAGRLSAAEAAKLADRLLDAAQSLFFEKGFGSTTMEDVARRAGSSTQTIYSRFANKSEMLSVVVRRLVERTVAAFLSATTADPHGVEPRVYLTNLGRQIAASFDEGAGLLRLNFSEAHRNPELRNFSAWGFGRGASLIQTALESWRAAGVLSPKGDLEAAATICLNMMTDRPRIRAAVGDPMPTAEMEAYVARAVDIFLAGCEA